MNVDVLLERTFERHAANAPSADGLVDRVQSRLARRRRRGVLSTVASVLAVAALSFGVIQFPNAVPFANDVLLPGWRWESYNGVEVQVPNSWGYSSYPWNPCFQKRRKPSVARPGLLPAVYCTAKVPQAEFRSNYLEFDSFQGEGKERLDHGWARETKIIAGVRITVGTNDAALRWRILGTARRSGSVDALGCPIEHPVPAPADGPIGPGLDPAASVESVSVCSFSIQDGWVGLAPGKLIASSRLEGAPARAVVDAVLAAPQGTGPNHPNTGQCQDYDKPMGDEPMVLRVHTGSRSVDVVVSFSVCAARWTFDGMTSRQLTKELLALIVQEPHHLSSFDRSLAPLVPRSK